MMTGSKVFLVIIAVLATADENGDTSSMSQPSRVARFSEAEKKSAQDELLGDTQVRIVRSPDKIAENNKKQHEKKNMILKSKMKKAAKQIKNRKNKKRKGKYGGRNSIVLTGESCDFIDFGSVRNVGAGCTDGTKMVVKNK